jgi:hypothetical protein
MFYETHDFQHVGREGVWSPIVIYSGSRPYKAPELFTYQIPMTYYYQNVDVWSMGVTFLAAAIRPDMRESFWREWKSQASGDADLVKYVTGKNPEL